MLVSQTIGWIAAIVSLTNAVELTGYEYIVVGSGAGGGPLAARLALAGHKTLLIESGDDQSGNLNTTVPGYNARATEDDATVWDFFVHHYADDARQARDPKTTYATADGGMYTGPNPPEGSTLKGTFYPRVGSLGGCTVHNAMITIYPHQSDFDEIAALTGDSSWSAVNMRKIFARIEDNNYLLPLLPGHGYNGWLSTEVVPVTLALTDLQALSLVTGGAFALGNLTGGIFNIASLVAADTNANTRARDTSPGYYQLPISTRDAIRIGSRDYILSVRDARRLDGSKRYPLDVRLNCHVTKVILDTSGDAPRATGVEFLDGAYLYRASPRSRSGNTGTPGSAKASREVIVAGGAYNSPQILKLSGIGPAAELARFGIPVVVDLPGVGTNLQDHYEVAVKGKVARNFSAAVPCTFGLNGQADPCLEQWQRPILGNKGVYSSAGFAAAMVYKSSQDSQFDTLTFGGPADFEGYQPGYSVVGSLVKNSFTWVVLKAHPRNRAGTVTLLSPDPLDVPRIDFNYFDTGTEGYDRDLRAMSEAIGLARNAFARQPVSVTEVLPGPNVVSNADLATYIKDTAWGHHASSSCPIGADGDPMAVLDSSFRVRGVAGLRVVDASVYPRIPGTFTVVSTYMVGEKAADVILSQLTG